MRRFFSKRQRRILGWLSGGKCTSCGQKLNKSFHADHIHPYSKDGKTVTNNGQALCAQCNLNKGAKMTTINLRPWQEKALVKATRWYVETRGGKDFLTNVAPGAGKTIFGCVLAKLLLDKGEIDRVVVLAPRASVVEQWAKDFEMITDCHMAKVTGASRDDLDSFGDHLCATWNSISGLQEALAVVCASQKVLLISDEHHHAAEDASWGMGADSAFADSQFNLILTGTPVRSDGSDSVWVESKDGGKFSIHKDATYTLTYGEAVDYGYCRPVTFHRHEGKFTVKLSDTESISVSGAATGEIPDKYKGLPGLQKIIDFYKLACVPKYEADEVTPCTNGYQASMLEWAATKLDSLRTRMPAAGGLVIAPNIEMAEYFVKLIEKVEGETPVLVHSQLANAESKIRAFRNSNKRWLVSVAMVSEGVDIPRLRVLVYLPTPKTELAFRQAIGRVVRNYGPNDDSRAYVVMPAFGVFEEYARRIEAEMSPGKRKETTGPRTKVCPACESECDPGAKECEACGHEFPPPKLRMKACPDCGAMNTLDVESCHACGQAFDHGHEVTLNEAMRTGAIVRGADITESEVKDGELIEDQVRAKALRSGDGRLIELLGKLPPESWGRLKDILNPTTAGGTDHA